MLIVFSILFPLIVTAHNDEDSTDGGISRQFQPDISLVKPFENQNLWDITGSSMISDKFIRLTPDKPSQQGSMWGKRRNGFMYWEVRMHFQVHGKGKTLFGDGFALWYTQDRMTNGPVFGSKNGFKGLGVFFDTYSNHQGEHNHPHPYLSAMVSNGSLLYDHDSDGTHTQLNGCHFPFRNSDGDVGVSIRYVNDILTVSTDVDNTGDYKECFEATEVILPTNYYFGFSAVTGDLSDNHDITAFKIFHLKSENTKGKVGSPVRFVPSAAKFDNPRDHVDAKDNVVASTLRSPLKTFLISVVVIVGAVFGIGIAYLFYKDREEKRNKRFY